ncbi:MAG: hypothetical protein VKS61_14965 [Candidatus Sericytochromatia bacterium]|nr:hypothetical protein [Candidatus Sericytochromatia bacterium]
MGKFTNRVLGAVACATLASSLLAGCKFFEITNPLIPKARVVAFPEPSSINLNLTYRLADNTIQFEVEDARAKVRTYQGDASPGIVFQGYAAEYFDQTNLPIASLLLSKVNFGVSAYLPPASGNTPSEIEIDLPIYNQQVRSYAIDQVFVGRAPLIGLNRNLIHTINCRVTLFGTDDNYNEIEVPFAVPIRFNGDIQP